MCLVSGMVWYRVHAHSEKKKNVFACLAEAQTGHTTTFCTSARSKQHLLYYCRTGNKSPRRSFSSPTAVRAAKVAKTGRDHGKAMEKPRSRPLEYFWMSVALPLASFLVSIRRVDHIYHLLCIFCRFLPNNVVLFCFPLQFTAPRRRNRCIIFALCRASVSKLLPREHATHVPRSSVRDDVFFSKVLPR